LKVFQQDFALWAWLVSLFAAGWLVRYGSFYNPRFQQGLQVIFLEGFPVPQLKQGHDFRSAPRHSAKVQNLCGNFCGDLCGNLCGLLPILMKMASPSIVIVDLLSAECRMGRPLSQAYQI
jgi:hypothetical protein